MLDSLRRWFHVHYWEGSAWNPYYVAHEQTCRCGQRRWRKLHVNNEAQAREKWTSGEHPEARRLRTLGLERNY